MARFNMHTLTIWQCPRYGQIARHITGGGGGAKEEEEDDDDDVEEEEEDNNDDDEDDDEDEACERNDNFKLKAAIPRVSLKPKLL
eukprot:CAMPEP_0114360564 /NCGR_PEP_ID=MMETSP0101-20121206/23958_1 /TAXON_ID=38822 ORGANISM="Pteridomonas danica, Strain PT" /NCGR_SAMPLE_ID=MMETSP0101 /ASSEMBLY_ACC=CAM_ASM_000211 /LENGTH=84 /DNA_ID=CAMNT_0001504863 /DNA_START=486 /DNA_END=741 /DNA_ORIENTATION=-